MMKLKTKIITWLGIGIVLFGSWGVILEANECQAIGLPSVEDVNKLPAGDSLESQVKSAPGAISLSEDKFVSGLGGVEGIFGKMIGWMGNLWQNYLGQYLLLIAVFLIIWGGARMVIAGGSEEGFEKGKKHVKWGLIFVALPALPQLLLDLGKRVGIKLGVFRNTSGTDSFTLTNPLDWLKDMDVEKLILGLSSIVLEVIGAIAIIVLVIGGSFWVFSLGSEKAVERGKKTVEYTVIGLVLILFSYSIVRLLSLAAYGGENGLLEGSLLEVNVYLKMAATMIYVLGPASLVAIMGSGYVIMVSQDDDYMVKAKRILIWAVLGLILALTAYGIVELVLNIKASDLI